MFLQALESKADCGWEEQWVKELVIIEDVPDNQPTTWCANPEAIWFCSDMQVPNMAIKRPVIDVPTISDIKFKLEGAKVFSVLDINEGYHQLELEEKSRHLTTFYGTQQKMRLNLGTISTQDIFDKAMDDTIEGLDSILQELILLLMEATMRSMTKSLRSTSKAIPTVWPDVPVTWR